MKFGFKLLVTLLFIGQVKVCAASEYLGNFKSGRYTSPEKKLVCSLPIFNSSEDFTENYVPHNEGISVSIDGRIAHFSRTSMTILSTDQAKYIKNSMTLEEKLLAIEKYWSKHLIDLMDSSDTKKEFLIIDATKYRLFVTTGTIDNKAMGTNALLFTIDGTNIILYMITDFDKTSHDKMEESLVSLRKKCTYQGTENV